MPWRALRRSVYETRFFTLRITQSRAILSAVLLTLIVLVAGPIPFANAQAPEPNAAESSVALPFIGEFEVWCTDRNPAPFNLCSRHHGSPAIDIGMEVGEPIYATGSGVVIEADAFCAGSGSCNNGAGNIVVIEHPDGTFSRYLHLDTVSVSVDQRVEVGHRLGTNGVTGHFSSAHLHYDEHFPIGQRVDLGVFVGCVDGGRVEYPTAFGFDDWNDVPFGSVMINDGFDCHGVSTPTPGELGRDVAPSIVAGLNSASASNGQLGERHASLLEAFGAHLRNLLSLGIIE